jgi:hypothetical protein
VGPADTGLGAARQENAMKATLLGIAMICALPLTAMAGQCPVLHAQIDKALGNRFDANAQTARQMAVKADSLHKEGKHADSEKMYKDAAKAADVTLTEKK